MQGHLGLPILHQASNERKHQPDVAERRCAQDRTKLSLEEIEVLQAVPDRTKPQHGVPLLLVALLLRILVGPEVKRTNRYRVPIRPENRLTIRLVLFILRRSSGRSQIEELRPVKPDSVSALT